MKRAAQCGSAGQVLFLLVAFVALAVGVGTGREEKALERMDTETVGTESAVVDVDHNIMIS
jgi:hypothetical protein